MSQKDCIAKFLGKINHTELFETSEAYQARGQSEQEAMLSAVQDKIDELTIEENRIIKLVRAAYVKDGGKELGAPSDSLKGEQSDGEPSGETLEQFEQA